MAISLHLVVQIVILLVICGIAWRYLEPHVAEPFRSGIVVVVLLAGCLWLLRLAGLL